MVEKDKVIPSELACPLAGDIYTVLQPYPDRMLTGLLPDMPFAGSCRIDDKTQPLLSTVTICDSFCQRRTADIPQTNEKNFHLCCFSVPSSTGTNLQVSIASLLMRPLRL
jgi:hypothetical protein